MRNHTVFDKAFRDQRMEANITILQNYPSLPIHLAFGDRFYSTPQTEAAELMLLEAGYIRIFHELE